MDVEIIGVFIPIIGILGGGAIALVAIVSDHKQKLEMVKQRMEIPVKKPYSNPYKSLRFASLLIGAALGIILGGVLENTGAFYEPEVGYFASIILFGGLGLLLAGLYINKKLLPKN